VLEAIWRQGSVSRADAGWHPAAAVESAECLQRVFLTARERQHGIS
jgi:hypothetical protein